MSTGRYSSVANPCQDDDATCNLQDKEGKSRQYFKPVASQAPQTEVRGQDLRRDIEAAD